MKSKRDMDAHALKLYNEEQDRIQRLKCEQLEACQDTTVNEDKASPIQKRTERRYQTQKDNQQRLKMRGRR